MSTTRRKFIGGCSAAIAAMAGQSKLGKLTFADPNVTNGHVLINIFLRGGWDAMNVIVPGGGADLGAYETARPNLRLPFTGTEAALNLSSGDAVPGATIHMAPGVLTAANGNSLRLHRRFARTLNTSYPGDLWDLWAEGKVAFVVASGLDQSVMTRSHFDAQETMELGTNTASGSSGWLGRHLQTAPNLPVDPLMTGAAMGSQEPSSLLGAPGTASFGNISDFNLQQGYWRWRPAMRTALRNILESDTTRNHVSGLEALNAVDVIEQAVDGSYEPENGADYNNSSSIARSLRSIAQLIKLDLGLQVATLDYGGWDTHNGQGDGAGGGFGSSLEQVRHALYQFYTDLNGSGPNPLINKVTVVIQSEFGRRFRENSDRGTDHGFGNLIVVMGGQVNGGVYGSWPGLAPDPISGQPTLFQNEDLMVTTDYRRVLTEIVTKQLCNPNIEGVFPGYGTDYYAQGGGMGIVQGLDPNLRIFSNGFESGDLSGWS